MALFGALLTTSGAGNPPPSASPPPNEASKAAPLPANPAPTFADVAYGDHPRQKIDFWRAASDRPTPVVFYVHGGGWVQGDKSGIKRVATFLASGISVVAVNYRYTWQAQAAGVRPPVKGPMEDIRRALQFVRSKAAAWNLDQKRIGAWGGSAGACSGLWLALHADMADPASADPVARESTRLWCAGVDGAQTTLDPRLMREWTPNSRYGAHAFGLASPGKPTSGGEHFAEFLARRDEFRADIEEYSPLSHASADDPPLCLAYETAPALGQAQKDPTHTANFGVGLRQKLRSLESDCELIYPGSPDATHATTDEFLIDKLRE